MTNVLYGNDIATYDIIYFISKFTLISMEIEKAIKFLYFYEFESRYLNIYSKYNQHKVEVGMEKNYNCNTLTECINIKY